ncbi:hypothetical protein BJ742DRAFT_548581 [Cladochytrium replicatum]|nr:hypothetical protein BJ742DRAFT_548581 [Cladochytrium replicatum]
MSLSTYLLLVLLCNWSATRSTPLRKPMIQTCFIVFFPSQILFQSESRGEVRRQLTVFLRREPKANITPLKQVWVWGALKTGIIPGACFSVQPPKRQPKFSKVTRSRVSLRA